MSEGTFSDVVAIMFSAVGQCVLNKNGNYSLYVLMGHCP